MVGATTFLPLCLKGHPKGELNHICPLEGQGRRHFIRLVHYNGSLEGILPPFFPPEGHFTVFCPSVGHLGGLFTTFFLLLVGTSSCFIYNRGLKDGISAVRGFFVSNIRLMSPSVGPLPRVVLETCIINIATVSKIIYVRPSSES